jgi:hypothetical protein
MKYFVQFKAFLLILLIFFFSCSNNKSRNQDEAKDMTELTGSEEPEESSTISNIPETSTSAANTDVPLDTILGRWLRPDGNYVIQINSIDPKNQIDAKYFNPKPIKIIRAEVIPGDNYRIFIEFDDEGYKGSSYDLIYDPAQDALSGKYFQATYGQTYQIGFIRLKE